MKQFVTALLAVLLTLPALAQTTFSIRGRVLDKVTGETLPGATVQVTGTGKSTGAGADADGSYKVSSLPVGTYLVQASFIGYKPTTQTVRISTQSVVASFSLASDNASLDEVQVVASQAQERETPVAFAAVNEVKLRETLSNRDLPLILNETPGVYATQGAGGGTGDSRINVRGFDQRNVAVLINGVPVNDMENGQVYWSNWDLGDVTKSLQVQRGLSAAKITVPSVGGTINVLTKGFDDKRSVVARAETGSNNYQKYSLMLSSGQLRGDWAVTAYGARRTQDGWVDKTFDDAWTFFGTVSKRIGKHTLSLTGMGSPQRHGQRIPFGEKIGTYSNDKARELGAATVMPGDKGFKYNKGWGYLDRYTLDASGNRVSNGQEVVNERVNYFFKPQVNLNHFWNVTDRLFVSTVLYASQGTGGGSQGAGTASTLPVDAAGQDDIQRVYDINYKNLKADGQRQSTQFLANNVNSHSWYGVISGFDYLLKPGLTLSAGVDARYYYGKHYRAVRDLLGGDYALGTGNSRNFNVDDGTRLRVGDKFGFYNDSKTGWLGGYGQLEYKTPLLSAVVSGTVSRISYARIDYFQPKQVTVDGKNYNVPFGAKPVVVNNQSYTNADGHYFENDWVNITGYSVKAGANYNLTEHDNLFANVGYNSKVPFYQFVFSNTGQKYNDIRNEGITSLEVGYGISYPSLKVTLNAYYTYWTNKTSNSISGTGEAAVLNSVRNVDARHMGIEMSVAQEISRRLQLNAAISLGDWRWAGNGVVNQFDVNNLQVGAPDQPIYLKGVHVGDAAQNQFQVGLRYEPVNNLYIRPSFLLFTKYYAGFDPITLLNEASRTDTYRVPTSRNLDVHLGYDLPKRLFGDKVRLGLKGSVLNVLNEFYISDVPASTSATNPSFLQGYFNRGRTFTVGLSATL